MSNVSAFLKTMLVLSVLISGTAHAQWRAGKGPVTKEGFDRRRDYEAELEASRESIPKDKAELAALEAKVREKGFSMPADRHRIAVLKSILAGTNNVSLGITERFYKRGAGGAVAVVGSAVLGSSMVAGEAEAATAAEAEEEVQPAPTFSRSEYRPSASRRTSR